MARYFLHLRDDSDEILDYDGDEVLHIDEAKASALLAARELLCLGISSGTVDLAYRIDVEDESGYIRHSLPFREAFEVIRS